MKWLFEIILGYDKNYKPLAKQPPTSVLKEKKTGSGGSYGEMPEMRIDPNNGVVTLKDEAKGPEAGAWNVGKQAEKKDKIIVPAMTKEESEHIIAEGLDLKKYIELRPHFFAEIPCTQISDSYIKKGFDGFSRSTVYSYHKRFRAICVQQRPISSTGQLTN